MVDEQNNIAQHTLEYLRRIDVKLDTVVADLADIKPRLAAVEVRLDRIEKRLGRAAPRGAAWC